MSDNKSKARGWLMWAFLLLYPLTSVIIVSFATGPDGEEQPQMLGIERNIPDNTDCDIWPGDCTVNGVPDCISFDEDGCIYMEDCKSSVNYSCMWSIRNYKGRRFDCSLYDIAIPWF